jgi:hypothetical protein
MEPVLTLDQAKTLAETLPNVRVTEQSIKDKIEKVEYYTVNETGTLCMIQMKNGWISTGFSAPADPGNFDPAIGQRYAYEQAFRPLWQLEGYLLRDKLATEAIISPTDNPTT